MKLKFVQNTAMHKYRTTVDCYCYVSPAYKPVVVIYLNGQRGVATNRIVVIIVIIMSDVFVVVVVVVVVVVQLLLLLLS